MHPLTATVSLVLLLFSPHVANAAKNESLKKLSPFETVQVTNAVQLHQAFEDSYGNILVVFEKGLKSVGDQLFFWGNRTDKKLYQLRITEKDLDNHAGTFDIEFDSPIPSQPYRTGKLRVVENHAEVSCDSSSACFKEMDWRGKLTLQAEIQREALELFELPEVRKLRHLFRLKGTNYFIYVDSISTNVYNPLNKIRILGGQAGQLRALETTSIGTARKLTAQSGENLGNAFRASFKDGSQLNVFPGQAPHYEDAHTGETYELVEIENPSRERLQAIGIDLNRIPVVFLRTPCEILLTK